MRTKSLLLPLAIAAASATSPAIADFTGGDFIFRVGGSYIDADSTSAYSSRNVIDIVDPDDPDATIPVEIRERITFDSDSSWFINGTFFVADHWAVELYHMNQADMDADYTITATGQDIDIRRRDNLRGFDTSVTSLFANWYPVCVESWVQPYFGLGVNYTDIKQDFLRPVFIEDVINDNGQFVGRADRGLMNFGSSWGWTAQVGIDIEFGRNANWLFNASAMWVDADPELELGVDNIALRNDIVFDTIRIREDLDYDSWIFNLGVGYKFSF
ncbi:hypothetical protein KUV22_04685 [Microbulbifer agarilyticus]|uniref:OmpW/AlkL family protein n=1 Tax=Microbulbifer agarilyticus TaxID=260552 RepID=UPI001C98C7F3|nr:OmpW family outer membrane protein [Microbulbifer agarilyticus]MBY6189708.1 hypothetical protein [Microbulbifer agarilyticus]